MAAIVVSSVTNNYLPLPKSDPSRISMAVWPTGAAPGQGAKAQAGLLGEPDFIVYGTTDTNTDPSVALSLTAQGVTFPAATQRNVLVKAFLAQAAETGYIEYLATVNGADGTTPEVDGSTLICNQTDAVDVGADPAITVVVTANAVLVNAVGDANVDTRWVIQVYLTDAIPLAFLATT
jgi:hypothetical protein